MRRIIYSDNGTLDDWSINLERYDSNSETFTFAAADDAIYIGSDLPFNHFYVEMGSTVNNVSSAASIALWDGLTWRAAEDIIDTTNGLFNSGRIEFTPSRDYVWQMSDTNYNGQTITALSTLKIYNMYWARLTYSVNLRSNVVISYIGQKFCDDTDLGAEFPALNRQVIRDVFTANMTSFNEQIIRASDHIVTDLKRMGIIEFKDQIIQSDCLRLPCVYKLSEIIFNALGDDYADQRDDSRNRYKIALDKKLFVVDKNRNAIVDLQEKTISSGWMYR